MNILNSISHWPKIAVSIYEKTETVTNGLISESWVKTATVNAFKYSEKSGLTDQAGKLQIIDIIVFVFDPSSVVNETGKTFNSANPLRFDAEGIQHFIEYKDDILSNEQIYVFKGRRDAA